MPTYNYTCKECNKPHTEFRAMKDHDKPAKCHKCNGTAYQTPSALAIHLDGSDPNWVGAHDRWVKEHETKGNGVRTR